MLVKKIISIINDIPILNPRRIIFTGGEPLLRNDLLDLATEVTRINKKIVLGLTTNGILININNSQQLVRLFDEIRISIDGPRDINDFQRGPNSFENAMHALKCIINAGGNPSAFITATSINIVHLKVFMKYLINQGICKIHISPVKIVGRAKDETLLCDFKVLKNIVQEFYFEQFGLQIKSRGEESCNCGVGNYISINPDGSVYPCHVLSYPELCIGNLRNESLHSIDYFSANNIKYIDYKDVEILKKFLKEVIVL